MPSPRRGTTLGMGTMEELRSLLRQLLQRISFGEPTETGNGLLNNMEGSWVEVSIPDVSSAYVCSHNLTVPVVSTFVRPNVRWLVFGMEHSDAVSAGNAYDAPFNIYYRIGDPITENSISLRLARVSNRTVDVSNPVKVTLFFIPSSQVS